MANEGAWGTDLEMSLLAHMLDIVVYSYKAGQFWIACFPKGIDHLLPEDVNKKSIYIYYIGNHYDVVTKVLCQYDGVLRSEFRLCCVKFLRLL